MCCVECLPSISFPIGVVAVRCDADDEPERVRGALMKMIGQYDAVARGSSSIGDFVPNSMSASEFAFLCEEIVRKLCQRFLAYK